MSDNKLAYSQDTSMELSEQDLDTVAGGTIALPTVAFGTANSEAVAFGPGAVAITETNTQNYAAPGQAYSNSSSAGLAVS